jgi:hypothetical protein
MPCTKPGCTMNTSGPTTPSRIALTIERDELMSTARRPVATRGLPCAVLLEGQELRRFIEEHWRSARFGEAVIGRSRFEVQVGRVRIRGHPHAQVRAVQRQFALNGFAQVLDEVKAVSDLLRSRCGTGRKRWLSTQAQPHAQ